MEQTVEKGARGGRGRGRSEAGAATPEGTAAGTGPADAAADAGSTGTPESGSPAAGSESTVGSESTAGAGSPAGAPGTMPPQAPHGDSGPVSHAVGYGAMSAGGAPPSGDYDVGYDGDFASGYAGDYGRGGYGYGGGYAPQGYGQGGYGRGGYGRGGYNAGGNGGRAPGGYAGSQNVPQFPSQHQVREISSRGLPVPPSYAEAQALLDSFEPSPNQQKRLDELGLQATTRGQAKQVLNAYVEQNPGILKVWEAENATAAVARRQERRGQQDPRVTSPGLFQLLADAGVTEIPRDHAAAAAIADALPPSEEMVRVLREHGRQAPATRAEAREIIRGLPATPNQVQTIMRRTGGRWAPRTRGEAERWFQDNPLPANSGGGYQGGGFRGGYRGGYGQRAVA